MYHMDMDKEPRTPRKRGRVRYYGELTKQHSIHAPDALWDYLGAEAALRNERDRIAGTPAGNSNKWTRSRVVVEVLMTHFGLRTDLPSRP